jgi:alpha-2-macroglobulin
LGEGYAGEHAFRGRTTERSQINVPMSFLMNKGGTQNLTLSKEGAGRLYYRIGMQYAPTSLQLKPADYGFTVTRTYEAIDNPNDVRRQEDGTWRIRAGAQVRVRLTMVAPTRRYHVALVDPLPAGFEALNPALATTGVLPRDPQEQNERRWWWQRQWFEHQNLRDERVEAFTSLLWEGVYNYSYIARATTPGVFIVPPSKAEEMYHPETFGRGASERVVIE